MVCARAVYFAPEEARRVTRVIHFVEKQQECANYTV